VLIARLYRYNRGLPYRATMEYTDDELRVALTAALLSIVGADGFYMARELLCLPQEELTRA